jgi:predicted permease
MSAGEFARRIMYFVRRDHYTAQLEEEIRLHIDLRASQLRGGGLSPGAARYAAKLRFGNSIHLQERSRDMWGFLSIEQLVADLRFAVRRLRRRPGFTASTIAVAAMGIGATTAVFTAIDAALLRPLPFYRPAELVTLPSVRIPFDPGPQSARPEQMHVIDVRDVAGMPDVFSGVAGYAAGGLNIDDPVAPRRVNAGVVTQTFFSTLGVRPVLGRTFTPDEGRPGGPNAVVLSEALWRTHFGSSNVLDKPLMLNGRRYTIVGIMPPGFAFPTQSDLWIPMTVPTTFATFDAFKGFLPSTVIARRARGVTPEMANRQLLARWVQSLAHLADTSSWARSTAAEYLSDVRASGAAVPLQATIVGPDRRKGLLILLGATVLLLLIACANLASLLLSDAATRRREVALREVLGASRDRIIRQLLAESMLLAIAGAIIGLALAPATLGLMRALMPDALAGTADVHVNLRVLAFASILALTTGIVFGLWPAIGASRADPVETMKSGGGYSATSGNLGHTRRILIGAELAMTVMLLIGSGLMLKSFYRLMTQDLGLRAQHTGTLEIGFAGSTSRADRLRVIHGIIDELSADRNIDDGSVGVVSDLPLSHGGFGITVSADGMAAPKSKDGMVFARYLQASGGYFNAMGIRILRGRTFDATDDTIGQRTAIINQQMAKVYWPGVDALHRTFHTNRSGPSYEVVGITADIRERSLDKDPAPQMYFSVDETTPGRVGLIARSGLPAGALLTRMTAAVHKVAPAQAVFNVRTMSEVIESSVAPRRTNTVLIGLFAALALVLSAFGVYAVVAYAVSQRRREFGIRAALGANRADILALVSREMTVVIAVGIAVGLAGAWALTRVMASMLYDVPTHDIPTFVSVPLLLVIPAAIAMLVPATRAMHVSPTEVMRAE